MPWAANPETTEAPAPVRDALTELHAYALVLDGELQRVEHHVAALHRSDDRADELDELLRRRAVLAAQLELLGRMIVALRASVDPAGRLL